MARDKTKARGLSVSAYLIAEEGPLSGMTITLENDKQEWTMGRDPDEASIILEDPMVSRKHTICRKTSQGYILENLSTVNPATQNGKIIAEPILLKEGDILQIGSTFFRFSMQEAQEPSKPHDESALEGADDLSLMGFQESADTKWLLKMITGPNSGAEFHMKPASSYIIGKDSGLCDIILQDLSVSRQHAKISLDNEGDVFIEDLGSRNGVLVNGQLIYEKHKLEPQDAVALGTSTFILIDKEQPHETIISSSPFPLSGQKEIEEAPQMVEPAIGIALEPKRSWKEMRISKRHLIVAGISGLALFASFGAMFALFHTEPIKVEQKNESKRLEEALRNFPAVQFSYNESSGKVFLIGHVLTTVDKQELLYLLGNIPYIRSVEDNVVVDELVWQNMNALLMSNPDWEGVSIHAPVPGQFVIRGYIQTPEQLQGLSDFININFPYLDRLQNQVVVESNLHTQVQGLLFQNNLINVLLELNNGNVVLSGTIGEGDTDTFNSCVRKINGFPGIRNVKNFVVTTTASTARIDVSAQYQVSGFSKTDENNFYVVINGKILGNGDLLDGMTITGIESNAVLLEKDGVKFKINYNLQ